MGLSIGFSNCSDNSHTVFPSDDQRPRSSRKTGNPNPKRFELRRTKKVGHFVIVLAYYPDCRNYEGNKILVFENMHVRDVKNMMSMDPHFCESHRHPSPVARFEPTARGWRFAEAFCANA